MSTEARGRAWLEIDRAALRRNYTRVGEVVGAGVRILPVVKADAYGVGFEGVVRTLEPLSPWGYGLGNVEEGRALRELGITRPALILAPIGARDVEAAVALDLRPTVSSIDGARSVIAAAESLGRDIFFHVEVDTGMGRAGFPWSDVGSWAPALAALGGGRARWEGVFSHFHSADRPGSDSVQEQADRFRTVVEALRSVAPADRTLHLCNSAGVFRRPDLALDLVRPGIFLYGGRPGPDLPEPDLVVTFRARIVLLRDAKPGDSLGYGSLYRATRHERWATVAAGYSDGLLPRSFSNGGRALVGGRPVPVVGRISMGMTVVDTTDLTGPAVEVGAPVTFLGADGGESISLGHVEATTGRSVYELLTGLSKRLPRIWV
jgi:alanine racemase